LLNQDLRSKRHEFDSQVVTTRIGDCLRTGKPTRYIINTKVNSALNPRRIGKSSTGLSVWS